LNTIYKPQRQCRRQAATVALAVLLFTVSARILLLTFRMCSIIVSHYFQYFHKHGFVTVEVELALQVAMAST
jgi:hypothetical protein